MPFQDTIDTFGYLLREVNKLGMAYIHIMRYQVNWAPVFDGSSHR
jgi:hypothetical protein